MNILAIDPGTEKSGICVLSTEQKKVLLCDKLQNDTCISHVANNLMDVGVYVDECAIEMVASYGMPVGSDVFETCVWIGRFVEQLAAIGVDPVVVYRKQVSNAICHSAKASDANVRAALIDMFPPTGGGKTPQVGTSKQPGPLYGIVRDSWSALAIAMTVHKVGISAFPSFRRDSKKISEILQDW